MKSFILASASMSNPSSVSVLTVIVSPSLILKLYTSGIMLSYGLNEMVPISIGVHLGGAGLLLSVFY